MVKNHRYTLGPVGLLRALCTARIILDLLPFGLLFSHPSSEEESAAHGN